MIASFYTLPAERRGELVEAFRPVEVARTERFLGLFRRTRSETAYPWFDYLQQHGHEEEEFDASGMVMCDFDLILAQSSASIFALGLSESSALSEHAGGSVALLDHGRAIAALTSIESLRLTADDVVRFYDADAKPPEWRFDPALVLAAREQLIRWCRTVSLDRLGLLVIG